MKDEILNIINHEIVPSKDDCLWRYAPEFAASKIEELFKQWHIAVVMQALPPETITKEAVRYDASFGLTYLSTRELQIKAFKDGASFALQYLSKAAVASEGQGETDMSGVELQPDEVCSCPISSPTYPGSNQCIDCNKMRL